MNIDKRLFRISAPIALFSLLLHGMPIVTADDALNVQSKLQTAFAEIENSGISALVAVSLDGGPVEVREFGAFENDGVPATESQVDILSLTKSVTAVAILKLVDDDKLELDERLDGVFADVPEDKAGITIHQLLTHSAGILDVCGDDHDEINKEQLLRCAFDADLLAAPGSEYNYSNAGYSILAAVVEERSGVSFEEFVRAELFSELGLEASGYALAFDEKMSIRSGDGRTVADASWGGPKPYWNLIGNGGMLFTPEEFVEFRLALSQGDIVSNELLTLAHTSHVAEDPEGVSYYGYGVVVQEQTSVGPLLWHNGGSEFFSSEWNEFSQYGLTVFTAGLQQDDDNAYIAMQLIRKSLRAEIPN
jgi:CubicO group peptidase (beta-lactamase class C family)